VTPAPRIPNLGAEEGDGWRRWAEEPAVAGIAKLWRGLLDTDPRIFEWLPGPEVPAAWLNTEDAAREAGAPLAGPTPACVREVHDKAFALRVAETERLVPESLRGLVHVFEPEELLAAESAAARIEALTAEWPAWTGGRYTLKPRFGSSGRGRVAGRAGATERAVLVGALPRLAERGGAVLEPWLERTTDLSAQLAITAEGGIVLLGTTTLLCDPSGVYRGHAGTFDRKGRTTSGQRHDEPLREAAACIASAAAAAGLRGPCGVDGFVFRSADGSEALRPVCEFNARYTAGTIALGFLRRHLGKLKNRLGLALEERGWFHFAPVPPAGGWPEPRPGELVRILLDPQAGPAGPALCAGRDPGALQIGAPLP
jgi:hypothetical protein